MQNSFQNTKSAFYNIDWILILIYLALVLVGWLNVYASVFNEEYSSIFSTSQRYGKQLLWIVMAVGIGMAILLIDPKFFSAFSFIIYGIVILVLIAVLVFGKEVNNARSWFQIGSFALQPSEFAKFATALAFARFLSLQSFNIRRKRDIFLAVAILLLPAGLIMLQPDMGSALVFFSIVLVLHREGLWSMVLISVIYLFVLFLLTLMVQNILLIVIIFVLMVFGSLLLRKKAKAVIVTLAIGLISIGFVFTVDHVYNNVIPDHQKNRIDVWTYSIRGIDIDKQDAGYNFYQSKVAIGSGGFTGKGFLKGTQTKMDFIPEQDTDFIFCTIGEEWGFLGSFTVVSLYLLLLLRIIRNAEKQRSNFSRIYGYSIACIFFFHFLINIGMTIGLVPVIGIPLPFISYGGSSLWSFTILLFIFIKQDSYRREVI